MARKLTRRERVIVVATIVLAIIFAVRQFGLGAAVGGLAVDTEELTAERAKYEERLALVRREPEVDEEFRELEKNYRIDEQADKEFTAQLEAALLKFGPMTERVIDPPRYELLTQDSEEYGIAIRRLRARAMKQEDVGKLLIFFDEQLIQVHEMKLSSALDDASIRIDATVSQMVKLSPEVLRKLKASMRRSRATTSNEL